MLGDWGDKIPEIRTRSGGDTVNIGVAPLDAGGVGAAAGAREVAIAGIDFKSPWLRDRVTLSLEAQIAMLEMRTNYRLTLADLGYTNKVNIVELRPGIFCKAEPTGCYRLAFNNR